MVNESDLGRHVSGKTEDSTYYRQATRGRCFLQNKKASPPSNTPWILTKLSSSVVELASQADVLLVRWVKSLFRLKRTAIKNPIVCPGCIEGLNAPGQMFHCSEETKSGERFRQMPPGKVRKAAKHASIAIRLSAAYRSRRYRIDIWLHTGCPHFTSKAWVTLKIFSYIILWMHIYIHKACSISLVINSLTVISFDNNKCGLNFV